MGRQFPWSQHRKTTSVTAVIDFFLTLRGSFLFLWNCDCGFKTVEINHTPAKVGVLAAGWRWTSWAPAGSRSLGQEETAAPRPASAAFSACLPDSSVTLQGFPATWLRTAKMVSVCLRSYANGIMPWALLCVCCFLSTLCLWDLCFMLHMVVDHSPGSWVFHCANMLQITTIAFKEMWLLCFHATVEPSYRLLF